MAIQFNATQADMNAAWGLLQRMFPGQERSLPNLVFGTDESPQPEEFSNPQHPVAQHFVAVLNQNMMGITTYATLQEMRFSPSEVEQFNAKDPRFAQLKQRILDEIPNIPIIQKARAEREHLIKQMNNATSQNS